VTPEEIPELIRTAVQQGSEAKVYLGIDARANYGSVKVLLDEIRIAKIENVVLLTD
jgi:biopolymer transport protein ExbD